MKKKMEQKMKKMSRSETKTPKQAKRHCPIGVRPNPPAVDTIEP